MNNNVDLKISKNKILDSPASNQKVQDSQINHKHQIIRNKKCKNRVRFSAVQKNDRFRSYLGLSCSNRKNCALYSRSKSTELNIDEHHSLPSDVLSKILAKLEIRGLSKVFRFETGDRLTRKIDSRPYLKLISKMSQSSNLWGQSGTPRDLKVLQSAIKDYKSKGHFLRQFPIISSYKFQPHKSVDNDAHIKNTGPGYSRGDGGRPFAH